MGAELPSRARAQLKEEQPCEGLPRGGGLWTPVPLAGDDVVGAVAMVSGM